MQNYAHLNRDVKMGPFIFQSRKNGSIIYSFLGNRGLIVYLATLKKGAIRAVHSYHVIFRESPRELLPLFILPILDSRIHVSKE